MKRLLAVFKLAEAFYNKTLYSMFILVNRIIIVLNKNNYNIYEYIKN